MTVTIGVGISDDVDPLVAFDEASRQAATGLGGQCDLAVVFASAPHLGHAKPLLDRVHANLSPAHLIGCGAGGVVAAGRELEGGPGAAVWAMAASGGELATHHLTVKQDGGPGTERLAGLPEPEALGDALLVLADPFTFSADALLEVLNSQRPGLPVLGGLASAAAAGSATLFRDGEVLDSGAVACSLAGIELVPCVSQGATPVGPEMTVTASDGNLIAELASRPAIERLREALGELDSDDRRLATEGLMLGLVIDENQPEYRRGDFLVRPIVGADPDAGTLTVGARVRIGQTVRMHVRDGATADADLREALRAQALALGEQGAAGSLLFTCNGRGSHMFDVPDHDATAIEDALGAPAAGFFCAGEIGPVGGSNFLHGFTATLAVFPR
jgi:small ligand-binding sensory domain FIST